jgi:hypothetical protein
LIFPVFLQTHSQKLGGAVAVCDAVCSAYLLTYLVTPCSTVLPEKPIGSQLVMKFPAFYGTRRYITAFTNARHMTLS